MSPAAAAARIDDLARAGLHGGDIARAVGHAAMREGGAVVDDEHALAGDRCRIVER